jgi:hypothetical protein
LAIDYPDVATANQFPEPLNQFPAGTHTPIFPEGDPGAGRGTGVHERDGAFAFAEWLESALQLIDKV